MSVLRTAGTGVRPALLCVVLIIPAMIVGCRTQGPQTQQTTSKERTEADDSCPYDPLTTFLKKIAENRYMPDDMRGRAEEAVQKLANGVLDPEPILVRAILDRASLGNFRIVVVDEDMDLRGIRIREERTDPDGALVVLQEDYPVYIAYSGGPLVHGAEEPLFVQIRTGRETKDEEAWRTYMIRALENLVRTHITEGVRLDTSDGSLKLIPYAMERAKQNGADPFVETETPAVWISAPQPGKVRVFLSVYDWAGNESEAVEVYDWSL